MVGAAGGGFERRAEFVGSDWVCSDELGWEDGDWGVVEGVGGIEVGAEGDGGDGEGAFGWGGCAC